MNLGIEPRICNHETKIPKALSTVKCFDGKATNCTNSPATHLITVAVTITNGSNSWLFYFRLQFKKKKVTVKIIISISFQQTCNIPAGQCGNKFIWWHKQILRSSIHTIGHNSFTLCSECTRYITPYVSGMCEKLLPGVKPLHGPLEIVTKLYCHTVLLECFESCSYGT